MEVDDPDQGPGVQGRAEAKTPGVEEIKQSLLIA